MGILVAFTYMAIRLLNGGIQIWKVSEDARDQDERARVVLDLIRQDLWLCDGSERSRFVVDHGEIPTRDEANYVCRLRFVRTMNRADEARIRSAISANAPAAVPGATAAQPNATAAYGPRAVAGPGIGLLEVAYAPVADALARDPALLVLRRAAVPAEPEPVPESIFTKDFFTRAKRGFADEAVAGDVIGGVLYFGVQLASYKTQSYEKPRDQGGLEFCWDSTRGEFLGPRATGYNRFSMSLERPILARERVFPRRARIVLLLAREDSDRREVRLAKDADMKTSEFVLDDPTPLAVSSGDFVKIGGEMCEVAEAGPRSLKVRTRGALTSPPNAHREGQIVHRGRLFMMEIPIAVWRDPDPSDVGPAR